MNHSPRTLAALLVLLSAPCSAASLYSGLRSVTSPSAVTDVMQVALPQAGVPTLSKAAPAPVAPTLALPQGVDAGGVSAAASEEAAQAQAPAQTQMEAVGAAASEAASSGDSAKLDNSFDGSFIENAIDAFHPSLPKGKTPVIAAKLGVKPEGGIPNDSDMEARMRMSPLTNPEREAAVIKLYQAGGAAAQTVVVPNGQAPRLDLFDTVQVQDAGKNRNNLIIVKKGRTDRIVVVGAHHDKVHEGAGTIDNWTGATMVTNLYQAMKDVSTDATFVFVAFSREEEGLLGSRFFADSLPKDVRNRIDSMVNLDTLGVDGTFSWKNNSDRVMLDRVMEVAKTNKRDLKEITLWGGDGDSSTFRRLRIAAFTLFGASPEVIWDIIHSASDTMASFSLPHYRNAYLLTLELLKSLDAKPIKASATI